MDRAHVAYSARSRHRRRRFLRTAQLNAVGFGALGGACLAAAAGCAPALGRTGWPLAIRAAPGPLAVVTCLVVLDRRKWARMVTGFSFTDDPARMRAVADQLVALGLPVDLEERPPGRPVLRYAHRHARQVHAALEHLGIPTPPGPACAQTGRPACCSAVMSRLMVLVLTSSQVARRAAVRPRGSARRSSSLTACMCTGLREVHVTRPAAC